MLITTIWLILITTIKKKTFNKRKENQKKFDIIQENLSQDINKKKDSNREIAHFTGVTNNNLRYPLVTRPSRFEVPNNVIQHTSYQPELYFFKVDTNAEKVDTNAEKVDINAEKVDTNNLEIEKVDTNAGKVDTNAEKVETTNFEKPSLKNFQSAKNYIKGGYLCNQPEYRKIFEELGENGYRGIASSQTALLPQNILKTDPLDNLLNPDNFRKDDLMLADNNILNKVIEPLTDLPCKINKPFLSYILENLPCIIETGVLPPLNKTSFESIQEWVLFQRKVFVSEKKCIIFTGKEGVRFTDNKLPQGLHRKLEEDVFKNAKVGFNSIYAISQQRVRTLQTAIALQNLPIYFGMQFDKRGRMYYKTEFNPLGDQFTRNFLQFSEPSFIKPNEESEFYFFVALGKAIKNHKNFQQAFDFVKDNKKEILDTLNNFHWVTFKEPFTALNLIIQFKKVFRNT